MTKKVSEIERGIGFMQDLIANLRAEGKELGMPFEALHHLVTPEGKPLLRDMIKQLRRDYIKRTGSVTGLTPWRTLTLDGSRWRSSDDYIDAIKIQEITVVDGILGAIWETQVGRQREEVDLILLSVADLGFDQRVEYAKVCSRAFQIGLQLCPREVGPALRLITPERPKCQKWQVASETAIAHPHGAPCLYSVENDKDGVKWLGWWAYAPGRDTCNPDTEFVFVLPKAT